jgi:hypothetical protein
MLRGLQLSVPHLPRAHGRARGEPGPHPRACERRACRRDRAALLGRRQGGARPVRWGAWRGGRQRCPAVLPVPGSAPWPQSMATRAPHQGPMGLARRLGSGAPLSCDELLALADGHRVIVGDRRVKAHIAEQLGTTGTTWRRCWPGSPGPARRGAGAAIHGDGRQPCRSPGPSPRRSSHHGPGPHLPRIVEERDRGASR